MNAILACVLIPLLQDPQPAPGTPGGAPAPAEEQGPRLDLVILKSGEKIECTVLNETDTLVQLRIDGDMELGLPRRQVERIERGAGHRSVPEVGEPTPDAPGRHRWFVLHDGAGVAVGWLHGHHRELPGGGEEIGEEWEFVQGDERTAVTVLEELDARGRPVSCYFRERTWQGNDDRVHRERIVSGELEAGVLEVQHTGRRQRGTRRYRMPEGATFPLAARRELTTAMDGGEERVVTVFDPAREAFDVRSVRSEGRRTVRIDGEERTVHELVVEGPTRSNTEWHDARHGVVRREINGPALVAMPATEERARTQASSGRPVFPAAFASETAGRFGLWLPNPAWCFAEGMPEGRLGLRCPAHEAAIDALVIDHLDRGATTDSAAAAVSRWYSLLRPALTLEERRPARIRDRTGVCLTGTARVEREVVRHEVYVVPLQDDFLVLACSYPEDDTERLRPDIARVLDTVELHSKAIDPPPPPASSR